jgi:hypothetical protein
MVGNSGPGFGKVRSWFLIAATAGGLTSGALFGLLSLSIPDLPRNAGVGVVIVMMLLALANDAGVISVPLPQNRRQVRQSVLAMEPSAGAAMFGYEMGTGMRTFMTGAAPYVVVAAILVSNSGLVAGIMAGLGFGFGRGLVPLARVRKDDPDWLRFRRFSTSRLWMILGSLLSSAAVLLALHGL